MDKKEHIIAEVSASMCFEGLPLTREDIALLKDCYGKPQAHYKKVRQGLVKKYSDSNESSQ